MTSRVHVFRKACQHGDLRTARDLVRGEGVPVDHPQDDGCTALWLASEEGHADVVDFLCRIGAETAATKTQGGVSCLYVAAQNGHPDVVKLLLDGGADPNHAKESGATPLFISSQQNNHAIASLLLSAGAMPDQPTRSGITPLMIACYQGHADIVRLLLHAGADPARVGGGKSPLDWALANGTQAVIAPLLDPMQQRPRPAPQQSPQHSQRGTPLYAERAPPAALAYPQAQRVVPQHQQTPDTYRSSTHTSEVTSYTQSSIEPPVPPQRRKAKGVQRAGVPIYSASDVQTPSTQQHTDPYTGEWSSPDLESRPSRAYEEANASLAKLFKIKDQPIDLESEVGRASSQQQSRRRASRSPGRSGLGKKAQPARKKAPGQTRKQQSAAADRTAGLAEAEFTPSFVQREAERSRKFSDGLAEERLQKGRDVSLQQRLFGFGNAGGATGGHPPLQWEDHKYKLAVVEDELLRTRHDVPDEWMFTKTEVALRRSERRETEDRYGFAECIVPSNRLRTTCETSPDRRRENTDNRRRMVLNAAERDLRLHPERVTALAQVMRVSDVDGLQKRVDQLHDSHCKLRDRLDYDEDSNAGNDFDTAATISALREGMPERPPRPPPADPAPPAPEPVPVAREPAADPEPAAEPSVADGDGAQASAAGSVAAGSVAAGSVAGSVAGEPPVENDAPSEAMHDA